MMVSVIVVTVGVFVVVMGVSEYERANQVHQQANDGDQCGRRFGGGRLCAVGFALSELDAQMQSVAKYAA